MQTVVALTVVAVAVAYAAWRVWGSLRKGGGKGGACDGCPLADACSRDKDCIK